MSNQFNIKIKGLKDFENSIKRNPRRTEKFLKNFFVDAIAVYRKSIIRQPWKVGKSGGGAPVMTGALRDSHQSGTKIGRFEASIGPDEQTAKYAKYVHGEKGQINRRTGVKARPWLDYAYKKGDTEVTRLQDNLLKDIVKDLAL